MLQWAEQPEHSLFFYTSTLSNTLACFGSFCFIPWTLIACPQAWASPETLAATSENQRFLESGKKCCVVVGFFVCFFPIPLRIFQGLFFSQMWVSQRFWGAGSSRTQHPASLGSWRDALGWTTAPADKPFLALLELNQFDLDFDTAPLSSPNIMGKEIICIWKKSHHFDKSQEQFFRSWICYPTLYPWTSRQDC